MAYPGGYKYMFGSHRPSTEYRDNYDRPKTATGPRNTGELGRPAPATKLHLVDRSVSPLPLFQSIDRRFDDPTPIDWVKPKPQHYLGSPRPRSTVPRPPSSRPKSPGIRSILKHRPFGTTSLKERSFPVESYIEPSYPTYYDSYAPLLRPESRQVPERRLPYSAYGSGYGAAGPLTAYDREVISRMGHETWSTTKRYETGYDTVEIITPRPPSVRPPSRPYTAVTREPPRYRNNWVEDSQTLMDLDCSDRAADLELLSYAKERMRERDLLYPYGL